MIVIDVLNPELEIIHTRAEKPEAENKESKLPERSKALRLQVISITGELVEVEY